jgi:HD-GYP domain-containing protein (c-di-GMP phosphodiesterase class II)
MVFHAVLGIESERVSPRRRPGQLSATKGSLTKSDILMTTIGTGTSVPLKAAAPSPQPSNELVEVPIDELIVGRPLPFPLFDVSKVLLLAEGNPITSEFKRLLKSRGCGKVLTSKEAIGRINLRIQTPEAGSQLSLDTELTRRLDTLIDGGLIPVVNNGPAVKDSVVFLGKRAYDADQRKRLLDSHDKNSRALSDMMGSALHGGQVDGNTVAMMAAEYFNEMTTDTDNAVSSVSRMLQENELSTCALETSLLAMALGIEMGLDADNVKLLGLVGLVHDWGMLRVPEELRDAPRVLPPVEFFEIKRHPIHSLEMLQRVSSLPQIVSVIAYQVHERSNGKGYPRCRKGKSIHPFASIIGIADAYTSLISPRPYRPALMPYAAMECLLKQGQMGYLDRDLVRGLLKVLSLFPIKSYLALSDGSVAKVIRRNGDDYARPIVQRIQDPNGNAVDPLDPDSLVDLAKSEVSVVQALPTPGGHEVSFSEEHLPKDR